MKDERRAVAEAEAVSNKIVSEDETDGDDGDTVGKETQGFST